MNRIALAGVLAAIFVAGLPAAARPAGAADPEGIGTIAFAGARDGEIYVINANGSVQRRLTRNAAPELLPKWSPDGKKIVFIRGRGKNAGIYVMNADGSGQRNLARNPAYNLPCCSEPRMTASNPTWSADGKRIAFARARGDSSEIYVMNAGGSGQRRLTRPAGYDEFSPQWSPDGKKIAFLRFGGEDIHLWVVNADGTGQHIVAYPYEVGVFSWSPDGRRIVFAEGNIHVVNADGRGLQHLTPDDEEDCCPTWSPDGRKIAFARASGKTAEIYVMNADGSAVRKLTSKGSVSFWPAWSPDGAKIAFVRGKGTLWVMNTDGGRQRKLAAQVSTEEPPVWQPAPRRRP